MKRYFLYLMFSMLAVAGATAQELTVKLLAAAGNDISASQHRRNDLNGQPCALVKVQLATAGAKFEGNVVGDVRYDAGEYWVYLSAGSKELRVKDNGFVACHVRFADYGIATVQSLQTYNLTLLMPQGGAVIPQGQKLIINYSPATATVLIDSKFYKGHGHIEATLPVGSHDYIIAADGYETVEGSVKLTANAPRTVNENLVATAQQSTAQESTAQQSNQAQSVSAIQPPTQTPAIETFTVNGVSFNMVRVDGGTFTMGATSEQGSDAYKDEKPAHQVTLSTYSIGETEVTQALWQAVMGKNPSKYKGDNHPVEKVSWKDCQEFVEKLNSLTGKFFRLPTEAEWEFAARGGNKSRGYQYSGSNNINDVAWYDDNSLKVTHDVKSKQPNELGLYDMSGNVWEWCQDRYSSYSSDSQTNPTGPERGSYRMSRGGSWYYIARRCRVAFRYYFTPGSRYFDRGLRLALQ